MPRRPRVRARVRVRRHAVHRQQRWWRWRPHLGAAAVVGAALGPRAIRRGQRRVRGGSGASRPERERVANPDSRRAVDWFEEWSGLIRTREVRAICVAQFAQSWGGYGLLSWLPTYFEEALGVPVADLAAFTVLPYFIQGVLGVGSGLWADALIREGKCSVKLVRRVFQTVGMVGPAACARGGGAGGGGRRADVFAAAAAVDVGLALSALTLAGVSVSHLDVAPRHAGLVFATGNTCATAAGIVAVPASGFILEATGQNWSAVFGVIAALYVAGAAVWWAWVGTRRWRRTRSRRTSERGRGMNAGGGEKGGGDWTVATSRRNGSGQRSQQFFGIHGPLTGPHIFNLKMKCRPTTRATTRSTKSSHTAASRRRAVTSPWPCRRPAQDWGGPRA